MSEVILTDLKTKTKKQACFKVHMQTIGKKNLLEVTKAK